MMRAIIDMPNYFTEKYQKLVKLHYIQRWSVKYATKRAAFSLMSKSCIIKSAFDYIRWPIISKNLKQSQNPIYLTNWIQNFLNDKFLTIGARGIGSTKQIFEDCPTCSCLEPLLWLKIVDIAMKKEWGGNMRMQAFAVDFIITLRAKPKTEFIK